MRSTFNRLSLEGLEDDTYNLDTDKTIESEDEPEDDEGGIEPVEYPDIGNLEVDQVHDELVSQDAANQAEVNDAMDVSKRLNAAVEAMQAELRTHGRIQPSFAKNASDSLSSARAYLGFTETRTKFAMEDYCGFTAKQTQVAIEDYKATLKSIYDRVIAILTAALKWAKTAFKAFFLGAGNELKATKSLTETLLKLRKDKRFEEHRKNALDDEHYVALPLQKNLLIYNGKQPGGYAIPNVTPAGTFNRTFTYPDYPHAFKNILGLVELHKHYPEQLGSDMLEDFEEICKAIQDGTGVPANPIYFSPLNLSKKDFYQASMSDAIPTLPGFAFMVNDYFLGGWRVVSRVSGLHPATLQDSLSNIAGWMTVVQDQAVANNDGWMRFVPTDELKAASAVVMQIEHELMAYEKTVDKMQGVFEKFKKMAVNLADASAAAPADYSDPQSANAWRGELLTLTLHAVNSIVANVNRTLFAYATRAHAVCRAWNVYLKEMYTKEKAIVQNA